MKYVVFKATPNGLLKDEDVFEVLSSKQLPSYYLYSTGGKEPNLSVVQLIRQELAKVDENKTKIQVDFFYDSGLKLATSPAKRTFNSEHQPGVYAGKVTEQTDGEYREIWQPLTPDQGSHFTTRNSLYGGSYASKVELPALEDSQAMAEMLSAVTMFEPLAKLNLANFNLSSSDVGTVSGNFCYLPHLKELNMSYAAITPEAMAILAAHLHEATAIETLCLGSNQLGERGAKYLADALNKGRNPKLRYLGLSGQMWEAGQSNIGPAGLRHLLPVLPKLTNLRTLGLSANGLKALDFFQQSAAFTHISSLFLGYNLIQNVFPLLEFLSPLTQLENLDLSNNQIQAQNLSPWFKLKFAKAEFLPKLRKLSLAGNNLRPEHHEPEINSEDKSPVKQPAPLSSDEQALVDTFLSYQSSKNHQCNQGSYPRRTVSNQSPQWEGVHWNYQQGDFDKLTADVPLLQQTASPKPVEGFYDLKSVLAAGGGNLTVLSASELERYEHQQQTSNTKLLELSVPVRKSQDGYHLYLDQSLLYGDRFFKLYDQDQKTDIGSFMLRGRKLHFTSLSSNNFTFTGDLSLQSLFANGHVDLTLGRIRVEQLASLEADLLKALDRFCNLKKDLECGYNRLRLRCIKADWDKIEKPQHDKYKDNIFVQFIEALLFALENERSGSSRVTSFKNLRDRAIKESLEYQKHRESASKQETERLQRIKLAKQTAANQNQASQKRVVDSLTAIAQRRSLTELDLTGCGTTDCGTTDCELTNCDLATVAQQLQASLSPDNQPIIKGLE